MRTRYAVAGLVTLVVIVFLYQLVAAIGSDGPQVSTTIGEVTTHAWAPHRISGNPQDRTNESVFSWRSANATRIICRFTHVEVPPRKGRELGENEAVPLGATLILGCISGPDPLDPALGLLVALRS